MLVKSFSPYRPNTAQNRAKTPSQNKAKNPSFKMLFNVSEIEKKHPEMAKGVKEELNKSGGWLRTKIGELFNQHSVDIAVDFAPHPGGIAVKNCSGEVIHAGGSKLVFPAENTTNAGKTFVSELQETLKKTAPREKTLSVSDNVPDSFSTLMHA